MVLFWKMVWSGSFVAPDFGWWVVRVSVIERLFLAVSLGCRWMKRTMAVVNLSSGFCEKAVVSEEYVLRGEFASDECSPLSGSRACCLDGVHLQGG